MKILCTGDVHIGRRSSRLPTGADRRHGSAADAWDRIVDLAIAERVDAVSVAGDLIDQSNRYFEAIGAVERGLLRLDAAGIQTLLVAGNHDHDVLPRLVDGIPSGRVHLLGRGGRWERRTIEGAGGRFHVDGWSFPAESVTESPIASYPALPADGAPTVVLLHADLDQPRSRYAPLASAELRRFPGLLFHLGHVHAPRLLDEAGGARVLYAGSPQALDPGETGLHGVHLVEHDGSAIRFRQLPLSTVRYESLDVPVDGAATHAEVDDRIIGGVREALDRVAEGSGGLRHLVCRVRLTGATPLHRELDGRVAARAAEMTLPRGALVATVDAVRIATRPDRDLQALARAAGPVGVLADLVLRLDGPDGDSAAERLVASAVEASREVEGAAAYAEVRAGVPAPDAEKRAEAKAMLRQSAGLLLDELIAHKEAGR